MQDTQKQLVQREATAVAQRHTTSNEIESIGTGLRQVQHSLASLESEAAEVRSLSNGLRGSQDTVAALQNSVSSLSQRLTESLKGMQQAQQEIEEQLTKVGRHQMTVVELLDCLMSCCETSKLWQSGYFGSP